MSTLRWLAVIGMTIVVFAMLWPATVAPPPSRADQLTRMMMAGIPSLLVGLAMLLVVGSLPPRQR